MSKEISRPDLYSRVHSRDEQQKVKVQDDDKINVRGLMIGFAAELFLSLQVPLCKVVLLYNPNISPFEILYIKSVLTIPMSYALCSFYGQHFTDVPKDFRKVIIARGLLGYLGVQGIWSSAKFMPIYLSTCIITTTPIWVSLIAYLYLNESLKKLDVFQMIVSFLGVIIINNPFQKDDE